MIDTNRLKGEMVANGYTMEELAKQLGIHPNTFRNRLKKGVFDSDDIEKMIHLLHIDDPKRIFFIAK